MRRRAHIMARSVERIKSDSRRIEQGDRRDAHETNLRQTVCQPPQKTRRLDGGRTFGAARLQSPVQRPSIHSAVCPTTGPPTALTKPLLHTVRSSASSLSSQHPLVFFWSSSNCLRLLPRLLVIYILPSLYLSCNNLS